MYLISDGGLSCNTPDTIESVMLTKNNINLDGVKLDVRKTLDNIYVISKYNELNKLTLSNKKVNECDYFYLRKVKFPSHIFKYYIPTLEEILVHYNKNKIIVLEIYDNNLDNLYSLLEQYPYKYYFFSKNNLILNNLKNNNFNKLGIILENNSIIIPKTNNSLYYNTFLIK